jgi:iron complex outermembrane receptor protein
MKTLSKLAMLVCASLSSTAIAKSLEGVVTGANGKPIANAQVKIHGLGLQTKTDESGRFVFLEVDTGITEVHISAAGFAHLHQDMNVPQVGLSNVMLVLKRSPIEVIDIVSTPLHMSAMESSMPINVLSSEALRRQQRST